MSTWHVVNSDQAEWDLRSIFEYIAFSRLAPEAAKKQARGIIEAIAELKQMPYRYWLYEKEPWQSKGLRFMPVGKFLVFCFRKGQSYPGCPRDTPRELGIFWAKGRMLSPFGVP